MHTLSHSTANTSSLHSHYGDFDIADHDHFFSDLSEAMNSMDSHLPIGQQDNWRFIADKVPSTYRLTNIKVDLGHIKIASNLGYHMQWQSLLKFKVPTPPPQPTISLYI